MYSVAVSSILFLIAVQCMVDKNARRFSGITDGMHYYSYLMQCYLFYLE